MHSPLICRKTSQQINVLKRIGKFLNFEARKTIHHAFILSNFNFCPLIWHFCSNTNSDKLRKVHFRALKFIFQDFNSSYDILLQKAGTTILHLSRMRNLALQTFEIVYGDSLPFLQDFIVKNDTSYNFRYTNLLELPRPKSTGFGINSFRYQAANSGMRCLMMPGRSQTSTHSEPSSRVGVVSNMGVLCAGNCRCLCALGTLGECTELFPPIYFVFNFYLFFFSLCLNVKSEVSMCATCRWFTFRFVSRAAWRHTALNTLVKWIPFVFAQRPPAEVVESSSEA